MIVARHDQHAAMFRGARRIGMAQHIAAPVDAGALAVPDAEHAVIGTLAPHLGLLGSPYRGGGQVLIEAGMELDVLRRKLRFGALEGLVDAPDRRAAIPRHIASRVEAGLAVERLLGEARPHHDLGT